MFNAVIDFGSYAEAAERMHVSQSSISHALSKLQEQLGLPLLTLRGRKAQLTEEGRVLLERSRDLMHRAADIEALAERLRHGEGQQIRILLEADYPTDALVLSLCNPALGLPQSSLSVRSGSTEQVRRALHENTVEFAISTVPIPGFCNQELPGIEFVAVASRDHFLFKLDRPLRVEDLGEHCMLALPDSAGQSPAGAGEQPRHPPHCLQIDSVEQAIAALRHGLAYAWLPRHRLQRCLDEQQLRILPLGNRASRMLPVYLVYGRRMAAGAIGKRFAEALCAGGATVRGGAPWRGCALHEREASESNGIG